jgi:hypothetical protein
LPNGGSERQRVSVGFRLDRSFRCDIAVGAGALFDHPIRLSTTKGWPSWSGSHVAKNRDNSYTVRDDAIGNRLKAIECPRKWAGRPFWVGDSLRAGRASLALLLQQ